MRLTKANVALPLKSNQILVQSFIAITYDGWSYVTRADAINLPLIEFSSPLKQTVQCCASMLELPPAGLEIAELLLNSPSHWSCGNTSSDNQAEAAAWSSSQSLEDKRIICFY